MIDYHYETDFKLENETDYTDWIARIIRSEDAALGQIDYIFCSDDYLLNINQQYLSHESYTDIITFDYSQGRQLSADIFISIDRVADNAEHLGLTMLEELLRVMSHGILHLLGYKDKTEEDTVVMREKENEKMELFHVEQ